jgi:hypothetical protein
MFKFLSVSSIFFLFIYFFVNIALFREGGVGYSFLFLFVIFSFSIFLLKTVNNRSFIKYSFLFILVFIFYFIFRIYIDFNDFYKLKAYTIGSSGGIVFGYCLGVLSSVSVSSFFNPSVINMKNIKNINKYILFLVLSYVVVLIITFLYHLPDLRSSVFLLKDVRGLYQRPASFISMSFVIFSVLVFYFQALNKTYLRTENKIMFIVVFLVYLLSAFLCLALSQMIGSNNSLVFVALVSFSTISFMIFSFKNSKKLNFYIKKRKFYFDWLLFIKSYMVLAISAVILVCLFIYIFDIDIFKLRIFNFGNKNIISSSLLSRLDILKDNFFVHLVHSFPFGNMNIDGLTTGYGSYVHSFFLAIITHLGFVGISLFSLIIFIAVRELIKSDKNYYYDLLTYSIYKVFKLYLFIIFLAVFFIASFFTFINWMPFWFGLGFIFSPFVFYSRRIENYDS